MIIAAAIAFKVVGKKLTSAAGDEVFPPIPFEPENEDAVSAEPETPAAPSKSIFEEAPRSLPEKKAESKNPSQASVKNQDTPILVEEEAKQREKIDPKKLVVYSEIMKPKYLEEN